MHSLSEDYLMYFVIHRELFIKVYIHDLYYNYKCNLFPKLVVPLTGTYFTYEVPEKHLLHYLHTYWTSAKHNLKS